MWIRQRRACRLSIAPASAMRPAEDFHHHALCPRRFLDQRAAPLRARSRKRRAAGLWRRTPCTPSGQQAARGETGLAPTISDTVERRRFTHLRHLCEPVGSIVAFPRPCRLRTSTFSPRMTATIFFTPAPLIGFLVDPPWIRAGKQRGVERLAESEADELHLPRPARPGVAQRSYAGRAGPA